jgi:hypothetical protein
VCISWIYFVYSNVKICKFVNFLCMTLVSDVCVCVCVWVWVWVWVGVWVCVCGWVGGRVCVSSRYLKTRQPRPSLGCSATERKN